MRKADLFDTLKSFDEGLILLRKSGSNFIQARQQVILRATQYYAKCMEGVIVKDSSISERGLFATRPFKKGEIVLGWNEDNQYLAKEEVLALPVELKHFVAIFQGKPLLIAEPERYMNHSCDPNALTDENGVDRAIRDIEAGEEITGSYLHIGSLTGFKCNCGSKKCRKEIPAGALA